MAINIFWIDFSSCMIFKRNKISFSIGNYPNWYLFYFGFMKGYIQYMKTAHMGRVQQLTSKHYLTDA